MQLGHVSSLEDFGTRSLAIHGIMVLAFANAVLVGLFVEGRLGLISFVALLNFTAGLWLSHSIHSLGNGQSDDEYNGILNEIVDRTDSGTEDGLDAGRLARLLTLIAAVTAVSLLTSAQVLSGSTLPIAIVAVGSVALVTAMIGFLIALGSSYDESMDKQASEIDQRQYADSDGGP